MRLKTFHIFHNVLNSDFSVDNAVNVTQLLEDFLCSPLKGSVLCGKLVKVFFSIFYVLCHKSETKASILILRHSFLIKNVVNVSLKCYTYVTNSN